MSAYDPNDPYDLRPRPEGENDPAEASTDVEADLPEAAPAPDQDITLHPISSEEAVPVSAVPTETVIAPPTAAELADDPWERPAPAYRASDVVETAYDPYDTGPERRGVPVWAVLLAVLLALGAGAAAGLMFPQVRGATKAEVEDAREKALMQEDAAEKAQSQIDNLEAQNEQLTQDNQKLSAERDKLGQTARDAQQAQGKLTAAEKLLATSTAKFSDTIAAFKTATDAPAVGALPQVSAFGTQVAVSAAAMSEEFARLHPLATAERTEGVTLVNQAVSDADPLVAQVNAALAECKDKACRVAAVDGVGAQLIAITDKLTADVTALLAKKPAAQPKAPSGTDDSGAAGTQLEGTGEPDGSDGTVGGDAVTQ